MKNSDEMVKSLFERREQYFTAKNIKRKQNLKIATSLAVFFTVIIPTIVVMPTLFKNESVTLPIDNAETTVNNQTNTPAVENNNTTSPIKNEDTPYINNKPTDIANENTTSPVKNNDTQSVEQGHPAPDDGIIKISFFNASPKDPDSDYFGEDEFHHINVILKGNRLYEQISESEYTYYGLKEALQKSDFGEFSGTITEIGPYSEDVLSSPCSQEPALAGCEVFYYQPVNCEAIIIVRGNEHCSLFRFKNFTTEGFSYADEYRVFNVSSADDIKRIDYKIRKPDSSLIVTKKEGSITATSDIEAFFYITRNLKPYVHESSLSGDPEWMIKAREEYKQLSVDKQIYIDASVVLKNGLTMNFSYQPNLGTGYIPGHFFLSEADNSVMKKLFQE